MTSGQSGGYKLQRVFGIQHELTRVKKTAGRLVTRLSAGVGSIKPPKIAVAIAVTSGLLGGRSSQTTTNEYATHGGIDDE